MFWQHMLAGATAGIAEHVAMFPVDTVKTRMQALGHPGQRVSLPRVRVCWWRVLLNPVLRMQQEPRQVQKPEHPAVCPAAAWTVSQGSPGRNSQKRGCQGLVWRGWGRSLGCWVCPLSIHACPDATLEPICSAVA